MRRIFVIAALAGATMFAIADGRVVAESGLVATCTVVAAPFGDDATWQSCRAGLLEGYPDLTKRSCTRQGLAANAEVWRCPAAVGSGRA